MRHRGSNSVVGLCQSSSNSSNSSSGALLCHNAQQRPQLSEGRLSTTWRNVFEEIFQSSFLPRLTRHRMLCTVGMWTSVTASTLTATLC